MNLTPEQISKLPPVELKVGRHYLTRSGSVTTIQQIDAEYDPLYPARSYVGLRYKLDGTWLDGNNSEHDIIAEVQITVPALENQSEHQHLCNALHKIVDALPTSDASLAAREAIYEYEHLPARS